MDISKISKFKKDILFDYVFKVLDIAIPEFINTKKDLLIWLKSYSLISVDYGEKNYPKAYTKM